MIAKAPEAPSKKPQGNTGESQGRKAAPRTQVQEVDVRKDVLKTFGKEYDLTKIMDARAYKSFLENIKDDYGYLLEGKEGETLMKESAAEANAFKAAAESGKGVKKAMKKLEAKLDKIMDGRDEEASPQERLALKLIVEQAMVTPSQQPGKGRQPLPGERTGHGQHHDRHHEDRMGKAAKQFREPNQPGRGRDREPQFEEVNPAEDMAPPLPTDSGKIPPPAGRNPRLPKIRR